jgi:hypothetical protein
MTIFWKHDVPDKEAFLWQNIANKINQHFFFRSLHETKSKIKLYLLYMKVFITEIV